MAIAAQGHLAPPALFPSHPRPSGEGEWGYVGSLNVAPASSGSGHLPLLVTAIGPGHRTSHLHALPAGF